MDAPQSDSETDSPVNPELEDDASEESEDFAAMFEASLKPASLREGDSVEGEIVVLGADVAFVDVGGKGEATIDIAELKDDEGDVEVEVGQKITAVVVSTSNGIKLSHKLARQAATKEKLRQASETGLPVEGRVEQVIKGGYEIRFAGQRGFCPISQMDTHYVDDPDVHVGKDYSFRIIELDEDRDNLVVSRRALLAEEEKERAEEVRKLVVRDAVLEGRVTSVTSYGAFVDLGGGVQGLLHVSEMGWSRVEDPASVVKPGDTLSVKILRIDEEKGRIALGLKQLQADPWSAVSSTHRVSQVLTGRVSRVADFGAFIEISNGIEALAHVSTFPPTGQADGWKDSVVPGTEVPVEILNIDAERKRIGVALVEEGTAKAASAGKRAGSGSTVGAGARLTGKVKGHESYGVFVFLNAGATGLIPMEETGYDREDDLRKKFPVGSDVEVVVLEVDGDGRRIRLSAKAVARAKEKDEARDYSERQERGQSGSFGSLADTLRKAMDKGNP